MGTRNKPNAIPVPNPSWNKLEKSISVVKVPLVVDAPNPRSLRAAREQRKLDLDEVATYTKISATRLEDFEAGTRWPSLRQTDQLSQLYNVPLYLLYLDATPNLETVLPDFRKADPRPADLSPRGLARLWAVEKISLFSKQLLSELSADLPAFNELPTCSRLTSKHASDLRQQFEDWYQQRQNAFGLSGAIETKYLSALRLYYESYSRISIVNEAPPSDYFGFYNEPSGGIASIFVNRKISSKKAQLFTFVHEFAHSLIRREGISDPFGQISNSTERACNIFAAEFLAPQKQFAELVSSIRKSDRASVFSFVRSVSMRSLLSQHATAVRLSELGHITSRDYSQWLSRWKQNPAKEKEEEKEGQGAGGPGAYAKQVGELGYLTVYLAGAAIRKKYVDGLDIQRGLGLSETVQEKAFALAERRLNAAFD